MGHQHTMGSCYSTATPAPARYVGQWISSVQQDNTLEIFESGLINIRIAQASQGRKTGRNIDNLPMRGWQDGDCEIRGNICCTGIILKLRSSDNPDEIYADEVLYKRFVPEDPNAEEGAEGHGMCTEGVHVNVRSLRPRSVLLH